MDIRLLNFISPKDLAKIWSSQLFFKIFLVPDICDSRGSYSRQPDPVTGCRCKVRPPCSHTPGHQFFFTILLNHSSRKCQLSVFLYTYPKRFSFDFFFSSLMLWGRTVTSARRIHSSWTLTTPTAACAVSVWGWPSSVLVLHGTKPR